MAEDVSFDGTAGAEIALVIVFMAFWLAVYLLPGIIASIRGHRQQGLIWAIDILLGWTFVGWVATLIWAFSSADPVVAFVPVPAAAAPDAATQIEQFARLHAQGALTDEEFAAKKAALLGLNPA